MAFDILYLASFMGSGGCYCSKPNDFSSSMVLAIKRKSFYLK